MTQTSLAPEFLLVEFSLTGRRDRLATLTNRCLFKRSHLFIDHQLNRRWFRNFFGTAISGKPNHFM